MPESALVVDVSFFSSCSQSESVCLGTPIAAATSGCVFPCLRSSFAVFFWSSLFLRSASCTSWICSTLNWRRARFRAMPRASARSRTRDWYRSTRSKPRRCGRSKKSRQRPGCRFQKLLKTVQLDSFCQRRRGTGPHCNEKIEFGRRLPNLRANAVEVIRRHPATPWPLASPRLSASPLGGCRPPRRACRPWPA